MYKRIATIKQFLLSVHFTEKEASVYLSLLELGQGTVSKIAQKADINRTTCYVILSSLVKAGLVLIVRQKPKQLYSAAPPIKIRVLLLRELRKNEARLELMDIVIPELKSIQNSGYQKL